MIIVLWLVVFIVHSYWYDSPRDDREYSFKEDFRSAILYVLMCCGVFSFYSPMALAVVMSCVIGCFYVFCGTWVKCVMVFAAKKWHWPMFWWVSNLQVATSVSFLFELYYYG